jgi:hypothetical protein
MKVETRGRKPVKESEKKVMIWATVKKKHKKQAQKEVNQIVEKFKSLDNAAT